MQNISGIILGEIQLPIRVSIFLPKKRTAIPAATSGIVVYAGEISLGGKFAVILGAKWRLHYYAHLNEINIASLSFVS